MRLSLCLSLGALSSRNAKNSDSGKKRKIGVVHRRRRVQIFWVLKHYGLLHLFLFAAPWNLVDMNEFLSFELVAVLLLLCEAVNFLQKSNKPNHSEKISKIVERSCSCHESDRQTNHEPKTAKNQNYQYVVDWNSFCLPSSDKIDKTYCEIAEYSAGFVSRRYGKGTRVFDRYDRKPSTKDMVHLRHAVKCSPRGVLFSEMI